MTTKTGSTSMKDLPPGPPFVGAVAGPILQMGVLAYTWHGYSTAHDCLSSPFHCISHPFRSDPWGRTAVFTVAFAIIMWLLSLRTVASTGTSDPSIVDRLWSIMPWLYLWHWCLSSAFKPRLLLMTSLATVWGFRLSYNFWIKGGFSGGEDYRWKEIRSWWPGWRYEIFNLVFVCCFQQMEILAFSVPAVAAMQSSAPLVTVDYVAAALFIFFVIGEAIADYQMLVFQNAKYALKNAGKPLGPYSRGFIESGLWAYSRHPNYFCEVSLWWAFYLFSVGATGRWFNWTVWGAVFLTGLFVPPGASLDTTEALSSRKYPAYAQYQATVPRFLPWPRAPSFSATQAKAK